MKSRRSARIYLFDPAGRVLLIRCSVVRGEGDEFVFWLTPGGEIEPGEEPLAAARRELREELGLELQPRGPVYTESNQFEHRGELRDNMDFYFVARCAADSPAMRGATSDEIAMMREIRWWSAEGVEAALAGGERIFPIDLAARMRRLFQAAGAGSAQTICPQCGAAFACGASQECWCASLPHGLPANSALTCLCPGCLRQRLGAGEEREVN